MEALALLSKQVFLRDAAVCEDQLICSGAADTHLLLFCTKGEARGSLLYDKCGDFFFLSALLVLNDAGNSDDYINVCFLTVGDEDLGAVKNPLVSLQDSLCLLALCVRTCARLS